MEFSGIPYFGDKAIFGSYSYLEIFGEVYIDVFRSVWCWECLKSPPNAPKLMPSGHQTWPVSPRTSHGHFDGTIIKKWWILRYHDY